MYTDIFGKRWYKGNLHAHTTRSDGKIAFDEAVSRYRYGGYDFLSVTDHWVTSETQELDSFLLLSGCEYDVSYIDKCGVDRNVTIHINGIGFDSAPKLIEKSAGLTAQGIIDAVHREGGIAILNHPGWSRNLVSDIESLRDLEGVEIYNTLCGEYGNWNCSYGYSGFHIDQLAIKGKNLRVFAADDAHLYCGEESRSFTMVQAETLTKEGIMDAIRKGRFYASQGPWVQTELKNHTLRIFTSPVKEILLFSNWPEGRSFYSKHLITGAECELPTETWAGAPAGVYYYRVEAVDENGSRAWTSPIQVP
jgi:hypothetical protein